MSTDSIHHENSSVHGRHDTDAFRQAMVDNLYFSRGQGIQSASLNDGYVSLAYTVRDYLMHRWRETTDIQFETNPRFVYYLSAEYLLGPQLRKNLLYTNTTDLARKALSDVNLDLDVFISQDIEPGLGNGGLGRLAACYLDSLATLDIPAVGYGIRYEYGIFKQSFKDGSQDEGPDDWLVYGCPWEYGHPDDMVEVQFGGQTEWYTDGSDTPRKRWLGAEKVRGEPYHMMMPGFKTRTVNMLRLWRARATREFDFQLFDDGDYARAVEQKVRSENITKVLYPNDNTPQGKKLRLKQQYFFVACSLRDIIRRFRIRNDDWNAFPDKVVIQLNDTHPVVAIPELMRILIDDHSLSWEQAWHITGRVFAYTCHTLLPEALEEWPEEIFGNLLPRHLEIIYEINNRFLNEISELFPRDPNRISRMSIIEDEPERKIRMANLACVGSFSINGVAELHSQLLRERTLSDFAGLWPDKFNNITNGVTPRRFMLIANPGLAALISKKIGDDWLTDLDQLKLLEKFAEDADFRSEWSAVKLQNKKELADLIRRSTGVEVDPYSIFDVMAKRLHEYKRQHLKALHIITLYQSLKADPLAKIVPRTFIFAAKAAPGYRMAKLIIKLINNIAAVVNNDPDLNGRIKVVFLPNFNVTLAEKIYPAADISEQISLAGKEASGTGNMKFALNGALTTGTLDGANIEIRDLVGPDNFFLFGLTTEEVFTIKENGYDPRDYYESNPRLCRAIDSLTDGTFSQGDHQLFRPIVNELLQRDKYLLLADYESYLDCQERADLAYRDKESWTRMSILNSARCGFFSSDRAIRQYCSEIWSVEPLKIPPDK
jgi:glycogen phosphorylase